MFYSLILKLLFFNFRGISDGNGGVASLIDQGIHRFILRVALCVTWFHRFVGIDNE